jgi:DNA-binding transcriptional regulator YdaS (Cro superfamily)
MNLSSYLNDTGTSVQAFARRIGVAHTTVARWISGEMEPRAKAVRLVVEATGGRVTAAELAPRAAATFASTASSPQLVAAGGKRAGSTSPTADQCLATRILIENKRQGWGLPAAAVDEVLKLGLSK